MAEIDCRRYAISSDGSRHGLPDPESVARIIKGSGSPCEIFFNYRSAYTSIWEDLQNAGGFRFTTSYGDEGHLKIAL